MFDKQYRFVGSHAEKVNALTAVFNDRSKAKMFETNINVYINAPLIGFLYKRKGEKDTNGEISPQNIFPEQLINASDRLKYILRLIILLDVDHEADESKRLDKAFRHLGQEEDLELFDQYVLGGVEVLYEKLIDGVRDNSDYPRRLFDFVEEVRDRFNSEVSRDEILALCRLDNAEI